MNESAGALHNKVGSGPISEDVQRCCTLLVLSCAQPGDGLEAPEMDYATLSAEVLHVTFKELICTIRGTDGFPCPGL